MDFFTADGQLTDRGPGVPAVFHFFSRTRNGQVEHAVREEAYRTPAQATSIGEHELLTNIGFTEVTVSANGQRDFTSVFSAGLGGPFFYSCRETQGFLVCRVIHPDNRTISFHTFERVTQTGALALECSVLASWPQDEPLR
jgi:hypothetical protein